MQWIYIICFALISAGLLALFGVRPGDFIDALFRSRRKAATLSDELNVLMGTPAKGFHTLIFTTPGKIALAICAAIILFALTQIMKLSKPIEYGGDGA